MFESSFKKKKLMRGRPINRSRGAVSGTSWHECKRAFNAGYTIEFWKAQSVGMELNKMAKHHFGDTSSSLLSCDHDDSKKELIIDFHSGASHCYSGVEANVFDALKRADSPGKFFHANIRSKYSNKKLG